MAAYNWYYFDDKTINFVYAVVVNRLFCTTCNNTGILALYIGLSLYSQLKDANFRRWELQEMKSEVLEIGVIFHENTVKLLGNGTGN